jgi:hypothetical protein
MGLIAQRCATLPSKPSRNPTSLADLADIPEEPPQARGVPIYHPNDHIRRAALAIV